ncbi:MAG: pirin family protein [Armatimonadota bacterium]
MINVIPASRRYSSDHGWLQTYWLFSFSDYHDPQNIHFGALRVFNDDTVQPGGGFPDHPHREMEIITIPLSGELTHTDSMGNRTVVKAGEVQCISAGTGIIHSEYNLADVPVHLYQIWIFPAVSELPPSYAQLAFDPFMWNNQLAPVASGQAIHNVVPIHANATIYRGSFDEGHIAEYPIGENRCIFIYVTGGQLRVNDTILNANDQARISEEQFLEFEAIDATDLVLIDVPPHKG